MKGLKIPRLEDMSQLDSPTIGKTMVASGVRIVIDKINWMNFPHLVSVKVYLGYNSQYLWLHYVVNDDFVRAVCCQDQQAVWQDSCVEFFVKQGDNYRNFEFNSLGVCLSAIGPDRSARERLDRGSMAQILRYPTLSIESLPSENVPTDWSLTVAIPLKLIGLMPGSQFMANFYKCGDNTKVVHYISWSPISTSAPDFHQSGFFAPLELAR